MATKECPTCGGKKWIANDKARAIKMWGTYVGVPTKGTKMQCMTCGGSGKVAK